MEPLLGSDSSDALGVVEAAAGEDHDPRAKHHDTHSGTDNWRGSRVGDQASDMDEADYMDILAFEDDREPTNAYAVGGGATNSTARRPPAPASTSGRHDDDDGDDGDGSDDLLQDYDMEVPPDLDYDMVEFADEDDFLYDDTGIAESTDSPLLWRLWTRAMTWLTAGTALAIQPVVKVTFVRVHMCVCMH